MNHSGFYALEGIDGAGKSTQAAMLVDALNANGLSAVLVDERSDTKLGMLVQEAMATHYMGELEKALLFTSCHMSALTQLIVPALARGWIVICDRFWLSTLAYQSDLGPRLLSYLGCFMHLRPMPMNLLLDVPASLAIERMAKMSRQKRPDGEYDLRIVSSNYRKLAGSLHESVVVFDGTSDMMGLHDQLVAYVVGRERRQLPLSMRRDCAHD